MAAALKQAEKRGKMSKLQKACKLFAKEYGVAVLKNHEDTSIIRWLGAGALTDEQKQGFARIYDSLDK